MTNSKVIRWGFIGCGSVTEIKSGPAYQQVEDFQVYGVTRRDKNKAEDYAKRHGIPKVYANAEELISDDQIDAIYIATPPDTHAYYGLKVAEQGKPCCIEKPMAPSYAESMEIYTAFKTKNIPLFIAYYRRSLPRFIKVKEWLADGEIGIVRHVRWDLSKPPNALDISGEYNWRTDEKVAPGGYFDDLASHGLDLFTYLLGTIKTVSGIATNQMGLYTAKDAIGASWLHMDGTMGTANWNFGTYQREDKVTLVGSTGKIEFSVFDEEPIICTNASGEKRLSIAHPKHIQKYHVENIKKHILGAEDHPSLGNSGLHTSWVMDKILGVL